MFSLISGSSLGTMANSDNGYIDFGLVFHKVVVNDKNANKHDHTLIEHNL